MKKYAYIINGNRYEVEIESVEGGIARLNVNSEAFEVEIEEEKKQEEPATAAPVSMVQTEAGGSAESITSPLPGIIIEISVKHGQSVKAGDKVAVLEAMKMENDILATRNGTISAIKVAVGDSVLEGADIVTIA